MGLLDIFKRRGAPLPSQNPAYGVLAWLGLWQNPRLDRLSTSEEQLAAYKGWVYAAVRRIVEDLRAARWQLVDKDGNSINGHPLAHLLERPYQLYTWGDLVEAFFLYHDLTGNSFLYIVTGERGNVVGIHPLSPYYVQQPVIEQGRFRGWQVAIEADLRIVPARELPWSRYPHPLNAWRGASPVEAFAASYELDMYARAYGAEMVRNKAGIPAGILSTDQLLDERTAERIREEWRQRHSERWGEEGPAVLGAGTTYQSVGIPLSDLRFLELAQVSMDQILAIYGVPASKLGLVKDVNRANADANDRTYRANVLAPRLRRLEELLNVYVIREFWPAEYRQGLRFRYADIVGDDANLKFQRLLHGLKSGAVSRNEYRENAGLEPLPEDALLVPAGLVEQPVGAGQQARAVITREQPRATSKDLELAALRYMREQEPLERSLKSRVRGLLSKEQKAILKAWREAGAALEQRADDGDSILSAFLDAVRRILGIYREPWTDELERSILEAVRRGWGLAFENPPSWYGFEPNAASYAHSQAGLKVVDIQETTLEELRRVVSTGIKSGASMDDIARDIARIYDGWKGYRAERIARTETASAINWGKQRSAVRMAEETGSPITKVWSSILDERTRPDHSAVHGQRAPLNEPFTVGGSLLMHPGDPDGPAEEVINCRCTVYYEAEGEEQQ